MNLCILPIVVNIWNQSAGTDHARLEAKKAELFAQRSATPTLRATLDEPLRERGRFREFWAARPVLSVAAMFCAPVAALLLFMALT